MKREVTIVYTVEDESLFKSAGNPLKYEHHGLRSHTISVGDVIESQNEMEATLQEIAALGFGDSRASQLAKASLDAAHNRITEALK